MKRTAKSTKRAPTSRADAHEAAGVELERAEGARAVDHRRGFVDVDARGSEGDLERKARGADRPACLVGPRERRAGALRTVRLLGVAIEVLDFYGFLVLIDFENLKRFVVFQVLVPLPDGRFVLSAHGVRPYELMRK